MGFLVEVLGQSPVTTSITLQTCYYCIQAFSPKGKAKLSVGEVKLSVGEVNSVWEKSNVG